MFWIITLIVGFLSCLGFCLLINIPRRSIVTAAIIGGLGWCTYQYFVTTGSSKAMAAFCGACVVALLSEISSRKFKEAATVYTIPGILPLVPGAGMYYTMRALINTDYDLAADYASSTFFIAGSIALALLVVGSVIKTFTSITRKY